MELTHLDETGAARMVDVGEKAVTRRTACAQSVITMKPDVPSHPHREREDRH